MLMPDPLLPSLMSSCNNFPLMALTPTPTDPSPSIQLTPPTTSSRHLGGATDVINVNYIAADDQGADSNIGSFSIELTGTNDAPVATYDASGFATEGDATPLTGQLTASDVDASGSLSFRIVDASGNDSSVDGLTLNSDGSFSFDPTNERFNYLAVNEQESVIVRYEVSDEQGGSNTGAFTIIVSGTNDVPTYTELPALTGTQEDSTLSPQKGNSKEL